MSGVDIFRPTAEKYMASMLGTLDPVPKHQIIMQPGEEVAWDACCDGQVWVRVIRVEPIQSRVKANGVPCGVLGWNVLYGAGVLRCVATVNDRGDVPSAAQITADGFRYSQDFSDVLAAVVCLGEAEIVEGVPLGPQGGCAGSEVRFTVRLPVCGC